MSFESDKKSIRIEGNILIYKYLLKVWSHFFDFEQMILFHSLPGVAEVVTRWPRQY